MDAISFFPHLSIDNLKCIECGICYSACKFPAITLNKDDSYILSHTKELNKIEIGCIFAQSDIKVSCISRITESLLLSWMMNKKTITINKGNCKSCKFKKTKKLFFYNLKKAVILAKSFGIEINLKIKTATSDKKFIPTLSVSRRDLLRITSKSKKKSKREVILTQIKEKELKKDLGYPEIATISIGSSCNLCGICEHVCPQEAILIEKKEIGRVLFNPKLCIGCKECTEACLYDAIKIKPATTKSLTLKPLILIEIKQKICESCKKPFYSTSNDRLCPACKSREQKKKSLIDFIKNI